MKKKLGRPAKSVPSPCVLAETAAHNLLRVRLAEGLSQMQLATRAASSQAAVSRHERGLASSLQTIEAFMLAMGRDPLEAFRRVKQG
jgi:transcriptional regulator with XRE-family HTH domain